MEITIHSTTKIVDLNGVPARIWEGQTKSGIKIHCFITRLAIDKDEPRSQEFEKELREQRTPTPAISSIPARLIL